MAIGRLGLWTFALDTIPMARAREQAAELEELGYTVVWLPEVAGRDPFVHAAMLLSATSSLMIATGIASIWARDAVTMNGSHRTLTEAFPERFLLGLGVSHQNLVEDLRGHDYDKPLTAMRAYLAGMDKAPFTGFRPTTPPRRVLGALRPRMLELAAEQADGAHPYFVPPEHTVRARAALGQGPLLCTEQAVLLETDPDRAREIARKHTITYLRQPNYTNNLKTLGFTDEDVAGAGSDRLVDAVVAWGDADAVRTRVQAHFDAGADHVCVQALTEGPRDVPTEQWRELAPALRAL
jgi:probable F420-dependent oxidoreductase